MLILSPWPELAGVQDAAADEEIAWMIELVSEVRSVRSEMNVPPAAQIPLIIAGAGSTIGPAPSVMARRWRNSPGSPRIGFAKAAPKGAVQIVTKDAILALPLAEIIDLKAEGERLKREIDKVGGEIEKLDQKLADEKFTSRAPEHVVEENRERRAHASAAQKRLA